MYVANFYSCGIPEIHISTETILINSSRSYQAIYTCLYTIPNWFFFFNFGQNHLTNLYLPAKIVLNLFISLKNEHRLHLLRWYLTMQSSNVYTAQIRFSHGDQMHPDANKAQG